MPCDIQRVVCRKLGIPIGKWFEFEQILTLKNRNSSVLVYLSIYVWVYAEIIQGTVI